MRTGDDDPRGGANPRGGMDAAALFGDAPNVMIRACLQGEMGSVHLSSGGRAALACLGDIGFFAGEADALLVRGALRDASNGYAILVPPDARWAAMIEAEYGAGAQRFTRYAMSLGKMDGARLARMAKTLPDGITLHPIDKVLFSRCAREVWCSDWVSQYRDFAMYSRLALGFAAMRGEEIVSGASSYAACAGAIEIQIDTKDGYRQRGLAAACGAKLLLECASRAIYPEWDAHNLSSASLAQKLGYTLARAYAAYEIMAQ